jgi:hypothetical protein
MAVIIKNLASGSLTNTTAKDLAPGSAKAWLVKSVTLTNRDSNARTIDVKVTGTSRNTVAYIVPPGMTIGGLNTVIIDNEITLQYPSGGTQEKITLAVTGTAASPGLDYVLSGVERDV